MMPPSWWQPDHPRKRYAPAMLVPSLTEVSGPVEQKMSKCLTLVCQQRKIHLNKHIVSWVIYPIVQLVTCNECMLSYFSNTTDLETRGLLHFFARKNLLPFN